jgi:hypothetical protein
VDLTSLSGTITSISAVQSSSSTGAYQILQLGLPGGETAGPYTVNATTAVFERAGSSTPTAASICRLAVGDEVQVSSGFGDVGDVRAARSYEVLLPPLLGQIVIQR